MTPQTKPDPDSDTNRERLQDVARGLATELDTVLDAVLNADRDSTAEDLLRALMRDLYALAQRHIDMIDLVLVDVQANTNILIGAVERRSVVKLLSAFDRIKRTGQLRPMPAAVLVRTYLGALLGHLVTERLMPGSVKIVSRLMPEKAWLDGMIDLTLFGMLEDDAR